MYKSFLKRFIDVVLSGVGLITLAIPMAVVAVAIKMEDPGPVFFKQKRVGNHKKLFNLYNLRWMQVVRIVHRIKACMRHDICLNRIADSHIHGFRHPNRGFVRRLIA